MGSVSKKASRNRLEYPEAERAVLGAVLFDGCIGNQYEVMLRITDILEPTDFTDPRNRKVYGAMLALHQKGVVIDLLTLDVELAERKELDSAGGSAYAASLMDGEFSMVNYRYYTDLVKRFAARRRLAESITRSKHQMERGDATDTVVESLSESLQESMAADGGDTESGLQTMQTVGKRAYEQLEKVQTGETSRFVWTGYHEIDAQYAPGPACLVVIGARTGMGKTALALGIADNMAGSGRPVYFNSVEMPNHDLAMRLFSRGSEIEVSRLEREKGIDADEWDRVTRTVSVAVDLPFYFTRYKRPGEIVAVAKHLRKRQNPIQAVFVDYLGLLNLPKAERHDLQLGRAMSMFADLAHDDPGMVVYVLSQISRTVDHRQDMRPRLADLKGSGSIEQDADRVYLLDRPRQNKPDDDVLKVRVAKYRNGPTGECRLKWDRGNVLNG